MEDKAKYVEGSRVASIDLGIRDSELAHEFDLKEFVKYIEEVRRWHMDPDIRRDYLAPYFSLIQSSGTGKTKLLYEAKEYLNKSKSGWKCLLLLAVREKAEVDLNVFDGQIVVTNTEPKDIEKKNLLNALDKWIGEEQNNDADYDRSHNPEKYRDDTADDHKPERIVIFVDESQHLLPDDCSEDSATALRVIRAWTREKRKDKHVVVVFTGTSSRLANFVREPAKNKWSRDASRDQVEERGSKLYPPFFRLHTMGIFARRTQADAQKKETEFVRSIVYGRPLFCKMWEQNDHRNSLLDPEGAVGKRMEPNLENLATMSILGTRAQMGQVNLDLASQLGAKCYAHIVGCDFDQNGRAVLALIGFLGDPVCARIAMMKMHSNPNEWMKRGAKLFSNHICKPDRGDIGEVWTTLYMLLCGDTLRAKFNTDTERMKQFQQFSVPLVSWLSLLQNPEAENETKHDSGDPSVSFIQVSRDFFRDSFQSKCNEESLKLLYLSGRAVYLYAGCRVFDLLIPIRVSHRDAVCRYAPLFVSIKHRGKFTGKEVQDEYERMKQALAGVPNSLCLLALIGWKDEQDWFNASLPQEQEFLRLGNGECGNHIYAAIAVPREDPFGVNTSLDCITQAWSDTEKQEIYASQQDALRGVALDKQEDAETAGNMLRSSWRRVKDPVVDYLVEVRAALENSDAHQIRRKSLC